MKLIDIADEWKGKAPRLFIERDMFHSRAFRALSGDARYVLMEFLHWRTFTADSEGKPVYDEGPYPFPAARAKGLGISSASFTRHIADLIEKGFLRRARKGVMGKKRNTLATYRLVDSWKEYR